MFKLSDTRKPAKFELSRCLAPGMVVGTLHAVASAMLLICIILSLSSGAGLNALYNDLEFGLDSFGIRYPFSALIAILLFAGVFIAWRMLIVHPLALSKRRYFDHGRVREYDLSDITYGFRCGYDKAIKLGRDIDLTVALWFVIGLPLLGIPGLLTHYRLSMARYILAENPQIGTDRAIELSSQMTKGSRKALFLVDLSMAPYYLLGLLMLIGGVVFMIPMHETRKSQAYALLRKKALEEGIATEEELPGYAYKVKMLRRTGDKTASAQSEAESAEPSEPVVATEDELPLIVDDGVSVTDRNEGESHK